LNIALIDTKMVKAKPRKRDSLINSIVGEKIGSPAKKTAARMIPVTPVRVRQELISRNGLMSALGKNLINPESRPRPAINAKSNAADMIAKPSPTISAEYILDTKIQNAKLSTALAPELPIRKMELVYKRVCSSSPYFVLEMKAAIPWLKENLSLAIPHLSPDGYRSLRIRNAQQAKGILWQIRQKLSP
jgi:hypothetical protein